MPTQNSGPTLKNFLASVDITNKSEEELLAILFTAETYPPLRGTIQRERTAIVTAIKKKDVMALQDALQKSFANFENEILTLPDQVATPIQEQTPEIEINNEAFIKRGEQLVQMIEEGPSVIDAINHKPTPSNRKFIENLVKPYTGRTREAFMHTAENIASSAQSSPTASPEQIIEQSIPDSTPKRDEVVRKMVEDEQLRRGVQKIQEETPRDLPNDFVENALTSTDPHFFKQAFVQQITTTDAPIEAVITKAVRLSVVADALQTTESGGIDYSSFFTTISSKGEAIEKALAPIADRVFSLFPKDAQEAVAARVLGASWNKEVSNNGLLQRIVGPALQSPAIQQAIQRGNTLFESSGKSAVFTKAQSFFVDVFVTVFHPEVSEIYLQLAQLGNTQMGSSVGGYYAGLAAQQGLSYVADKGVRLAGKAVAKKAAGTAVGKIAGTIAGGATGNPFIAWVGSLIGDKIIGGIVSGAKKLFGFITLDWLGKLMSGSYESGPITKDPIFIFSAVVVGVITLLFVIPILPFSLGGSSVFQQTVQDNAFIQGLGGFGAGPIVDCVAEPNNPLCSMSACDTTKQDCRWPTSGTITQGPHTSCGGSHARANAIDIGAANGTDVYATIDGTITGVFSGCADNTGYWGNTCGGGYGNYIIIQGSSYSLMFGHLSRLSITVHKGDYVSPTTVIGEVDHTGNSSGPHLHFEYRGPGSINSILPTAIPSCSNGTSGCPSCPSLTVGGGT